MPRKRKKKNVYWTAETDKAIAAYKTETDATKKNEIFERHIYPAMFELAHANYCSHGSNSHTQMSKDEIVQEMVITCYNAISSYNPERGGFQFFNMVSRNRLYRINTSGIYRSKFFDSLQGLQEQLGIDEVESVRLIHTELIDKKTNIDFLDFIDAAREYWDKNWKAHFGGKCRLWPAARVLLDMLFDEGNDYYIEAGSPKHKFYDLYREACQKKLGGIPSDGTLYKIFSIVKYVNQRIYKLFLEDKELKYSNEK